MPKNQPHSMSTKAVNFKTNRASRTNTAGLYVIRSSGKIRRMGADKILKGIQEVLDSVSADSARITVFKEPNLTEMDPPTVF